MSKKWGEGKTLNSNFLYSDVLKKNIIFIIFVIVCILAAVIHGPAFFSTLNLSSILGLVSVYGILSIGQGIVVLSGNIDLSQSVVAAFSTVNCVWFMKALFGWNDFIVIIVTVFIVLGLGALIGAWNGVLVRKVKIPSMVATLITYFIAITLGNIQFKGFAIPLPIESFTMLASKIGFVPIPFLLFVGLILLFFFMLKMTSWGRGVYASGGNEDAAFKQGINVNKTIISVFIVSGILSALCGLVLVAQMECGDETLGAGFLMYSIAIVSISGIRLGGGSGDILKLITSSLILSFAISIMTWSGISAYSFGMFIAIMILVSAAIAIRGEK